MSRRTRAPRGEAAPAKPGARDAATINSIKFSELTVGLEVEGEKFPGVAKIKSIEQMKDRTDDNGDRVACLFLKRAVGRMPMDPNYIMSFDKFWLVGAKTQTPQDARDSEDDDFYVAPEPKRSRVERAKDVENKALQEAAEAEERSNKRQKQMEEDAAEEDARTLAPAPPPSPGSGHPEWLNKLEKKHIDVMNVAVLKEASSRLGLSTVGNKETLKKRLMSHLKLGGAASGLSNPSRAILPNPPASPPGTTTGVTVNAGQEWFPQAVVNGELSTHEKELLSDKGMNTSSECLLSMEHGELRSTYLNVMRRTNTEATDDQLVADAHGLDRDQMISPLELLVREGRLTLHVDRDDGKLKLGLYHLSTADLHAAEARAEALASRGLVKVRLVSAAL